MGSCGAKNSVEVKNPEKKKKRRRKKRRRKRRRNA